MELIIISRTKLKVMLSAEDMKKLDFDPCAGGDLSGRTAFKNILKEARDRCGFDAVGQRVFVQYYPEKHGGCEMFVTKLTGEGNCSTDAKDCARTKETACGKPEYIIYRFRSLEDTLSLCAVLKKRGYTDESRFFVVEEKNRRYYLCLSAEEPAAGEFGGVLMSCNELCYLAEHGRIVCSDAVNVLGNLR